MKNNFFVLALLGFVSQAYAAPGDPFEIVQDGYRYRCTAIGGGGNPGGVLDCVEYAYSGPFSRDESTQLCSGAISRAPADCARSAYSGPFSKSEAIALCTGTYSPTGPIECANAAYQGPFSRSESISLCARHGTIENAQCAIRAYAGPYSKEEAIRLCRSNPALVNKLLIQLNGEEKTGFDHVLKVSKQKASKADL